MKRYPLMMASPSGGVAPLEVIARLQKTRAWTWEIKMDGCRALMVADAGTVTLMNRNGRDIGYRYPDVMDRAKFEQDVVLDGELVVLDASGRPDFHLLHRRDAQGSAAAAVQLASAMPAQFAVFDVLSLAGVDLRLLPYTARRAHLEGLARVLAGMAVVVPPVSMDGPLMWQVVQDMGLEGLVAKRNDSRYEGRRSQSWVKVKASLRVFALVSGYDPGQGRRAATFGALRLSLVDDDDALVSIGSVGSGFTEAEVGRLWGRLQAGDHPIVVEVTCLEVSPSGMLRQPVYRGTPAGLGPADCTVDQLDDGRLRRGG